MTKYSFFQKVIGSFYSKDMYAHVGLKEIGKSGIKYLFLIIAILWIPEIVKMQINLTNAIKHDLPPFVEKVPTIEIKNGVVSFDKPSPYIIKDDETGQDLFIFDTSGEYTSLEGTTAKMLLTESKLVYEKSAMETREYDLSNVSYFTLTHDMLLSWAQWGNYLGVIFYILIVPFALLWRMFIALLYALIGLIIQSALQTKFNFQTIFRLSIIAMTPAYVADKLLGYFGLDFTGETVLCIILSIGMLYFAMKSTKEAELAAAAEFGTNDGSSNSSI